jgi:hypothetical protein
LYVEGGGLDGPRIRAAIPLPSLVHSSPSFFKGVPGKIPFIRLGFPLGYGFPGIVPQEDIIA